MMWVALSWSEARRVSSWLVKWTRSVVAIELVRERGKDMMEHGPGIASGLD
jgi:hypothetical protein